MSKFSAEAFEQIGDISAGMGYVDKSDLSIFILGSCSA